MPTILITGANRGIGLEFTRQYLVDSAYDAVGKVGGGLGWKEVGKAGPLRPWGVR